MSTKCPRCGADVADLVTVDANTIEILRGSGIESPPQVCAKCIGELRSSLGRGGLLMAKEKAKEQQRLMMWKGRVNLIKKARNSMLQKNFSEAAINYEKYLRVLEVVFDVRPGELKPEMFKDTARTSEITAVASVYWDLLRVYDTSDKYAARQQTAARQLALFLPFTPIFPDIVKKADSFTRSAKNPSAVRAFLKAANVNKSRCFIATAAFESPYAPEVIFLQNFRDDYLMPNWFGYQLVHLYYRVSPSIARIIDKHEVLKSFARKALRALIRKLTHHFYSK